MWQSLQDLVTDSYRIIANMIVSLYWHKNTGAFINTRNKQRHSMELPAEMYWEGVPRKNNYSAHI